MLCLTDLAQFACPQHFYPVNQGRRRQRLTLCWSLGAQLFFHYLLDRLLSKSLAVDCFWYFLLHLALRLKFNKRWYPIFQLTSLLELHLLTHAVAWTNALHSTNSRAKVSLARIVRSPCQSSHSSGIWSPPWSLQFSLRIIIQKIDLR